jgi:hypothetical protein
MTIDVAGALRTHTAIVRKCNRIRRPGRDPRLRDLLGNRQCKSPPEPSRPRISLRSCRASGCSIGSPSARCGNRRPDDPYAPMPHEGP